MDAEDIEVLHVELKYCERCGGLWLRPCGSQCVYCAMCALAMSEFAASRKSKRRARLPVNHEFDIDAHRIMELYGKGGNA